jgi:hypothetical protein
MIVNKCDNCQAQFEEGQFPEWLQLTSERGILIVGPGRSVVKYQMLDFCSPLCAQEFLTTLTRKMSESACQSKSE